MPRNTVPSQQWIEFFAALTEGFSKHAAAKQAGIPYNTVMRLFAAPTPNKSGYRFYAAWMQNNIPDPTKIDKLAAPAKRALNDFEFFRRRYLGRVSMPWQIEAGERMAEWIETPDKEYVVVNAPPGSGKSTLFTSDIPTWLVVRNRALRCLLGSRTQTQARMYTGRIKRNLERLDPVKSDQQLVARGLAVDAEGVLVHDYGRFKPVRPDLWRLEQFTVAQHGDVAAEDKEPTFSAFGMDSGFLGGRYDLSVWDDLIDRKTSRTVEARENTVAFWDTEAESRCEPGGLVVLQGQRIASDDLYRHALDLEEDDDLDDDEDELPPAAEGEEVGRPRKYRHIVYRAHYEELCKGTETHKRSSAPWPNGCLLDPVRLRWRDLATLRRNKAERFMVMYQQEDVDPSSVLVPPVWIDGGTDPETGIEHLGCWDKDRRVGEVPAGLVAGTRRVVTVDPSGTKNWSVQDWLYNPEGQMQYLIDQFRGPLEAPELLDWSHEEGEFVGLLESWWQRSVRSGKPITHVIVEQNAAQRYLLQFEHAKRWSRERSAFFVPHDTYANKADPQLGIESIAPHYRHGRVRLPGHQATRAHVLPLYNEVTRWPDASTEDCVMGHWFLVWQAQRLFRPAVVNPPRFQRPAYLRSVQRGISA